MDQFIGELIEYSRNGQTAVARVPVELDPLIRETWEDLRHTPGAAAIRFACQGPAGLRPLSDPVRLRIILKNLLSNAIKYHDLRKSDAFIRVEVGENPPAGQFILRVQDNGQGIGEACREKVFDLFYRASHQAEGSGLGLHIVRQAVEKLGGTISLQTREKEGTTFTVCLPGIPPRTPDTP
jgi:signal transduction histidine kinase